MNLPDVINVAIGLVVLYLLLSTIASTLVDLVTRVLRYREEILVVTINRLLTGLEDVPWDIGRLLWDRLLDFAVGQTSIPFVRNFLRRFQPGRTPLPSTGDAELDRINAIVTDAFWNHAKIRSLTVPGNDAPPSLDNSTFANVVIDFAIARDSNGNLPQTRVALERRLEPGVLVNLQPQPDTSVEPVNATVSTRLPGHLRQALLTLGLSNTIPENATGEELWQPFRENLASWYGEAMDRASVRFKRFTHTALLWIGVTLAALVNADTIRTIYVLSQDESVREATAAYGEMLADRPSEIAAAPVPGSPAADEAEAVNAARQDLARNLRDLQAIERLGFPIGWAEDVGANFIPAVDPSDDEIVTFGQVTWQVWLWKFLGLGLTAGAVSQGAPFWYDLLNKLVAARRRSGAGAPDDSVASPTPSPGTRSETGGNPASGTPGAVAAIAARPLEIGRDISAAAVGMDPRKAYWLAEASELAYRAPDEIRRVIEREWFFRDLQPSWRLDIADAKTDTQAFAFGDGQVMVLAFRGTEPTVLQDLKTDAKFRKMSLPGSTDDCRVHRGFSDALDSVYDDILAWVNAHQPADKTFFVTGHSLGAALATLFVARYLQDPAVRERRTYLYTYGCPRVGDGRFARMFDRAFPGRAFRFVHGGDAITQVPPLTTGFHHVGEMMHFIKVPEELRREVTAFDRMIDLATGAAETTLAQAGKTALNDHSMANYVTRCRKLTTDAATNG